MLVGGLENSNTVPCRPFDLGADAAGTAGTEGPLLEAVETRDECRAPVLSARASGKIAGDERGDRGVVIVFDRRRNLWS